MLYINGYRTRHHTWLNKLKENMTCLIAALALEHGKSKRARERDIHVQSFQSGISIRKLGT